MRSSLLLPFAVLAAISSAQSKYDPLTDAMGQKGMNELGAYHLLEELSGGIGPRLSGSPYAAKAVDWGQATMKRLGFQNVHLVPCMVPHWVRGDKESLEIISSDGSASPLSCCALGMSPASPDGG